MKHLIRWAAFAVGIASLLVLRGMEAGTPASTALAAVVLITVIAHCATYITWIGDAETNDRLAAADIDIDERARATATPENLWSPRGVYSRAAGSATRVPKRAS